MPAERRLLSQASPLLLVRDTPWIARDDAVARALTQHPTLPVRDTTVLRNARLVAFVLALQAAGDSAVSSIDTAEFVLESDELQGRLAMSQPEADYALCLLSLAGMFELVSAATGHVRFAPAFVAPFGIASHIRWPVVLDRLTDPPRQGTQTALMLFRLFVERLKHPGDRVAFPYARAEQSLGLGGDRIRRGIAALLETDLWESDRTPGQRSYYRLGSDVLVGIPRVSERADERETDVSAAAASPPGESPAVGPSATLKSGDLVIQIGGRRITVPPSITDLRLPEGSSRAAVEVDPATGNVRITLAP